MNDPSTRRDQELIAYKARLGLWMFVVYALIYGGFVYINTFHPRLMGLDMLGVNLAVVYGLGLIVFAVILALIYNSLCARAESDASEDTASEDSDVR
ncbi:MAG: DUF485 domain-containing protein [Armatimonadetes bacterium]|nr:DUF485 domain-containing protein [Armatimonadota bacterium]